MTVSADGKWNAAGRTPTTTAHLAAPVTLDRMTTRLAGLCGLVALLLVSLGVYGMASDAVQRRTREIGLGVARGADGYRVGLSLFLEVLYPAGGGLALGFYGLYVADRVVRSYVCGVPAPDAWTLSGASALLLTMTAAAGLPALRRALRVSPGVALRSH